MNAADTKVQKKYGIEDSAELFIEDTMKGGKNKNNKELVDLSEITSTGGKSVKRTHRRRGSNSCK